MTDDDATNNEAPQAAPVPTPDLATLDRLVGTWTVSGEAREP